MGNLLDDFLGGHGHEQTPTPSAQGGEVYTPPSVKDVDRMYRETGKVPYSYYGAGAPTREGELPLVKASYSGAFATPPAPSGPRPGSGQRDNMMDWLGHGPLGAGAGGDLFARLRAMLARFGSGGAQ